MRAQEFIVEQVGSLPEETRDPMQHSYVIPGIRNNDAYHTMRLSVAMARARAELGGVAQDMPPFTSVSAVGQNAVVVGFNDNVEAVLDRALSMTETPGGKRPISSKSSDEPSLVNSISPVKAFSGYPR